MFVKGKACKPVKTFKKWQKIAITFDPSCKMLSVDFKKRCVERGKGLFSSEFS